MAAAQVQQVVEALAHGDTDGCVKEGEKNREIIQDPPCTEVGERASHVKVHEHGKGGCTDMEGEDELEVQATDTDEGQRSIAEEVEAKLAVQPAEAEEKETREGRLGRGAKKTEKAAAKGAIVPVDNGDEVAAPGAAKKKAEKAAAKWAVVPVDDEVVAPAGDLDPVAAPVSFEEAAEEAGEEATKTKGGKEDAREEKAHDE